MQNVILGLLLLSPMSLYDLHHAFTQGVSLFYSASFGSIQRALRNLTDAGLVEVRAMPGDPRGKKLHSITPAGRSAWDAWMHEPVSGSDPETTMLARVFFLGLLEDDDDQAAVVATLRARVEADLAGLRGAAAALDAQDVPGEFAVAFRFQRATLDYGLRAHELAASWLDELDAGLTSRERVRG